MPKLFIRSNLSKLCVSDINLANKRIAIRADFDIPIVHREVVNNERIVVAFTTIRYCLNHFAHSVVVYTHLGKPDGRKLRRYSIIPILKEFNKLMLHFCGRKAIYVNNIFKYVNDGLVLNPPKGSVIFLENIQFYVPEMRITDDKKRLASKERVLKFQNLIQRYADVYVNDAFRFAHLTHTTITPLFYKLRVAGFSFAKELQYFRMILERPKRPMIAILGGDKIVDKLRMVNFLIEIVDEIIIGGAVAFTFLKETAKMNLGFSLFLEDSSEVVRALMQKADEYAVKIHLPEDFITGQNNSHPSFVKTARVKDGVPYGDMALDIARESTCVFADLLQRARTVIWNGPMGAIENIAYRAGSMGIMLAIQRAKHLYDTTNIIIGEDTASFITNNRCSKGVEHVSVGKAPKLLLMGKTLPGIDALQDKIPCVCNL